MKCTHYACRCDEALRIAVMADRTEKYGYRHTAAVLARHAALVHDQEVDCRLVELEPAASAFEVD